MSTQPVHTPIFDLTSSQTPRIALEAFALTPTSQPYVLYDYGKNIFNRNLRSLMGGVNPPEINQDSPTPASYKFLAATTKL